MILKSEVSGFTGDCKPTWLNKNGVLHRLDGGVTGFFRMVRPALGGLLRIRTGEEFHGIIGRDGVVRGCK